jgi:hypothetical protein
MSSAFLFMCVCQCNDRALAHIKLVRAGAWIMLGCQPAPAHRGESRDEASVEAAHQEEETTAILDGSRRLAEADSE